MIKTYPLSRWESYSATMLPHSEHAPRVIVSRSTDKHEVRISFLDGRMQQAVFMTPAEAADLRDMLAQALAIVAEAA